MQSSSSPLFRMLVGMLIVSALLATSAALPSIATAQPAAALLTGQITDADGQPVEDVRASLHSIDNRGRTVEWLGRTFSNASGDISFDVSANGCYRLVLFAPADFAWENAPTRNARHKVCTSSSETITDLGGVLHVTDTLATISGTVTRGTSGERNVKVNLWAEADGGGRGDFLGNTFTGNTGEYEFAVAPVCHFVAFTAPAASDRWSNSNTRFTRTKVCPAPATTRAGVDANLAPAQSSTSIITVGSGGSTAMRVGDVVNESSHGTRIYCPVSHFAHEDPIVLPGEPNASHLHMFWGNTDVDAFSTGESLLNSGRSTCEGGVNNRSSYWMPAFFNDRDEVVLPDRLISYYKSFGVPDRSTIQPIPNGLQMLANQNVNGSGPWNFRVGNATVAGQPAVALQVQFPTCVEVDGAGEPVLTSADNVSHLSYAAVGQPNACPTSHPYRIAGLIYIAHFAVDPASDWYIASDVGGPKGASLHADYIAAWDETVMADLTRCNIENRDCAMAGGRSQLPERFLGADGTAVYGDSTTVLAAVDRTPFGTTLTPMPN